jgi:hypothetical protein
VNPCFSKIGERKRDGMPRKRNLVHPWQRSTVAKQLRFYDPPTRFFHCGVPSLAEFS